MNAFRKAFKHKLKAAGIARHWHDTAYPGERYDAGQKEYFQDMAERHHEGDWKHVELPVADIEGHHEGHDASEDYIKEYAEKRRSGSEYPPIIVGPHPELPGKWRTIDGQHRLNAARVTGDKTIRAYVPIKKGEQGDWKAEGYKISHKVWNAGGGQHVVRVTATDPQGKPAGGLTFNHYPGTKGVKFMQADSVAVHPDHRRKGIASAMYQYGEKLTGLRFQPARSTSTAGERDDRTDEGKALWNQKNRPFGKSESYFAKLKKSGLEKGPYGPTGMDLYSQTDNARRKMGRTSEVATIGPNKAVQGTKPSAKLQAAAIAAEARAKSKKNPVKVYSRAEINKLMRSGFKMPRGPKIT